ncbi:hypothetical protein D3C72_1309120 [compost metagenome]
MRPGAFTVCPCTTRSSAICFCPTPHDQRLSAVNTSAARPFLGRRHLCAGLVPCAALSCAQLSARHCGEPGLGPGMAMGHLQAPTAAPYCAACILGGVWPFRALHPEPAVRGPDPVAGVAHGMSPRLARPCTDRHGADHGRGLLHPACARVQPQHRADAFLGGHLLFLPRRLAGWQAAPVAGPGPGGGRGAAVQVFHRPAAGMPGHFHRADTGT